MDFKIFLVRINVLLLVGGFSAVYKYITFIGLKCEMKSLNIHGVHSALFEPFFTHLINFVIFVLKSFDVLSR